MEYHDTMQANTEDSIDDVDYDSSYEFVNEYLLPHKVSIKQGKNFKTVIGDQPMRAGGKYFFQILVNKGYLFKVGVCRRQINPEEVSAPQFVTSLLF